MLLLVIVGHSVLVTSEPPTEQRLHHYLLQVRLPPLSYVLKVHDVACI